MLEASDNAGADNGRFVGYSGEFTRSRMKNGKAAGFHPMYNRLSDEVARIFEAGDQEGHR